MTALLGKPLLYCYILLGSFWVEKPAPAVSPAARKHIRYQLQR
jgi:hypothetical protein